MFALGVCLICNEAKERTTGWRAISSLKLRILKAR